jgi:transcriptional antiterminator NusG
MKEAEARRLLKQVEEGSVVTEDTVYEEGQEVHVIDGPFANFNGVASKVDNVKQKMTVTILVFDRETSVDLDFTQVERV